MSGLLAGLAAHQLVWLPALGIGHYPVDPTLTPYDQAYWDRYRAMDGSPMGRRLTEARLRLISEYLGDCRFSDTLLDVGVGGGAFLDHAAAAIDWDCSVAGYDVNPAAVAWLRGNDLWCDLWSGPRVAAATFWDSLEHLPDPVAALDRVGRIAFVSLPIFDGPAHVLRSRHFRPTEHYWYFTRQGFIGLADKCGFAVRDIRATETAIGREDIETFVLERR